jgi:hypothetical protein
LALAIHWSQEIELGPWSTTQPNPPIMMGILVACVQGRFPFYRKSSILKFLGCQRRDRRSYKPLREEKFPVNIKFRLNEINGTLNFSETRTIWRREIDKKEE